MGSRGWRWRMTTLKAIRRRLHHRGDSREPPGRARRSNHRPQPGGGGRCGSATDAVVDGLTETGFGDRGDGDAGEFRPVEVPQHGEQVGCRLVHVALRAEVERCRSGYGTKAEKRLARGGGGGVEANRSRWGVVLRQQAGRAPRRVSRRFTGLLNAAAKRTNHRFDGVALQAARAQEQRLAAAEIDHGGSDAEGAGPGVEKHCYPPIQSSRHVPRQRRAQPAGEIGRGGGDRPSGRSDQRARHRMRRCPQGDGGQAGTDQPRKGEAARRGSTRVNGPGQKRSINRSARSSSRARRRACAASSTWTIKGLKLGRPLAAKIAATARSLPASAPRP